MEQLKKTLPHEMVMKVNNEFCAVNTTFVKFTLLISLVIQIIAFEEMFSHGDYLSLILEWGITLLLVVMILIDIKDHRKRLMTLLQVEVSITKMALSLINNELIESVSHSKPARYQLTFIMIFLFLFLWFLIATLQIRIQVRLPINLINGMVFIFISVHLSDDDEDQSAHDEFEAILKHPTMSIMCLLIVLLMFEAYNYHLSMLIKDRLLDVSKIKEL